MSVQAQDFVIPSVSMTAANTRSGAGWRSACRGYARKSAEVEARAAWRMAKDDLPPFNARWEHVCQVVGIALWLAHETGADPEIVEAAAWLHDVCKRQPNHAVAGADAARRFLPQTSFPTRKIPAVADAIYRHEGLFRKECAAMEPLEAAVLWDADKLSKIGVQALVFYMSSQSVQGRTLAERRKHNQGFLEEVLARTVQSMNTPAGRRLAQTRYRQQVAFMTLWEQDERLGSEFLSVPDPLEDSA